MLLLLWWWLWAGDLSLRLVGVVQLVGLVRSFRSRFRYHYQGKGVLLFAALGVGGLCLARYLLESWGEMWWLGG